MAQRVTDAARAREFARTYVDLVEALQQVGVPAATAREEARMAALTVYRLGSLEESAPQYDPALGPCPTCQRG